LNCQRHQRCPIPLLRTLRLDLLPATLASLRAELESREALAQALGVEVPETWPPPLYEQDSIHSTLTRLAAHPDEADWGFYYLALRRDGAPPLLLGAGGFKGAPDAAGTVEIGYSVLPEHQRQGYATEAVGGWVQFAFASERVARIIGQTLPSLGPSIRVLERAGFRFAGLGEDPHAPPGEPVLQYELPRP
jgi:RimJ/RimL family protein N-acetyltransferase